MSGVMCPVCRTAVGAKGVFDDARGLGIVHVDCKGKKPHTLKRSVVEARERLEERHARINRYLEAMEKGLEQMKLDHQRRLDEIRKGGKRK